MLNLGLTPKKQSKAEKLPQFILNTDIQLINGLKKYKKMLKNCKNNTVYIISKKMKFTKTKTEKEFHGKSKKKNHKENTDKNKNKNNKNNFRAFLYYKLKKKYDSASYTYNVKKINELIFNIPSKFTANFKDYLLIEEDAEFLKREYHKEEFNKKFKKIFYFYEKYSKTFPNYTILNEGKYMHKNILKKQKMIDELQKIKEEEEEKTNSKLEVSNETVFTNNAIESINNEKDSFWINKLKEILYLDKSVNESYMIEQINSIIDLINQCEKLKDDKLNKKAIYKAEFEKIKNLSKPLYMNQKNPRMIQIKEKINQINKYRNNFELMKKSKNNWTIESSYNSFSTSINNKSFNNKGIIKNSNINSIITNLYEEKKENNIAKKKMHNHKELSLKKGSKEKDVEKERLSNISHKYQKTILEKNTQEESKFSNSMIPNKVKNYFKINDNNKKQIISTHKKKEYSSYNIGSLFNSRKDRCKELLTEKKLISVFNKYINNKTRPFKKNSYFNLESINSQMSQYSHIKNEYIVSSPYNLNPKTYNKDIYNSRSSYEDNNVRKIKKNKKNYSLTKKSINKSINISIHHSFLNNSISCLRKNKNKNGLMIKHNTKKFIKNLDSFNFNINKNKLYLRSKILKNNKNKSNKKKQKSFLNINYKKNNNLKSKKKKNTVEKNYLKTSFNFVRSNNNNTANNINNSINNTNISIENQSMIYQKKKNYNYNKCGKKIILPAGHSGRNEKFSNLKFACGKTFHSIKSSSSKNDL